MRQANRPQAARDWHVGANATRLHLALIQADTDFVLSVQKSDNLCQWCFDEVELGLMIQGVLGCRLPVGRWLQQGWFGFAYELDPPRKPALNFRMNRVRLGNDQHCNTGKDQGRHVPGATAFRPTFGRDHGLKLIRELVEYGWYWDRLGRRSHPVDPRPEPIQIDGYDMGVILGRGGMGAVYQATRRIDGFPVAIKVLLPKVRMDEASRQRFLREIDVLRSLEHPHIATLLEANCVGKAFCFVMDFCSGGSLADLAARQGGRLALPLAGRLMLQCVSALAHAHEKRFVHRDLKPANILLHQQERGWAAKLSDFGLAKHWEQSGLSGMTLTGTFGGTFDYMPREQLTDFKTAQPASDIWSFAATFYQLLTGHCPRDCPPDRDPIEVVLRDAPVPLRHRDAEIPGPVAAVIDRALEMDPTRRFQDGSELEAALAEVI